MAGVAGVVVEPAKVVNKVQHRVDTIREFDKQFGPFEPKELEVVGSKYDILVQFGGKLILGSAPRNAAKNIASGLLGQILRS